MQESSSSLALNKMNQLAPKPITRPGFSMIEVVISVAIIGGLLASVFNIVGVSAQRGFATTQRTKALWLANDLLAEIGAKPCTSDAGNILTNTPIDLSDTAALKAAIQGSSRAAFDSLYDYNSWTSSPPVGPAGDPIAGYEGWTRAVTVVPIDPETFASRVSSDTAAIITVVALGPGNARQSVSIIRTNAADAKRGLISPVDAGVDNKAITK